MRKTSPPAERRISRALYCDLAINALLLAFECNQGLRPIVAEVIMTMAWYWIQGLSPKISDAMRLHEVARDAEADADPQQRVVLAHSPTGQDLTDLGLLHADDARNGSLADLVVLKHLE